MRVISFVAQKGGVAKSTTALGLACTAVSRGKNAAVLDMDPQASAAEWAEGRTTAPGVAQLLDPIGLPTALDDARGQGVDWLVVDTPPRADGTAGPVATASDIVFVPVLPAVFDVRAIRPTLVEIYRAGAHARTHLLLTLCPPRQGPKEPPAVIAARTALAEAYGEFFDIAPCTITRYEAVRAALETSRTVAESDPASKAALELDALYNFAEQTLNR
jgi:chromosome partitioning protein